MASKVLTAVPFSSIDTVLVDAPALLPDGPVIVGASVSIVIDNAEEAEDVLPAASVAVAVSE